jgi:hypothetical protein
MRPCLWRGRFFGTQIDSRPLVESGDSVLIVEAGRSGMARTIRAISLILAAGVVAATSLAPVGLARAGEIANSPDAKAAPIDVNGCWKGELSNDSLGNTSIFLVLDQVGSKIRKGSYRVRHGGGCFGRCLSLVRIGSTSNISTLISGTVDSTGFKFIGRFRFPAELPGVLRGHRLRCGLDGSGVLQGDGSISGNYLYLGECKAPEFVGGDFSITPDPTCIP